jgi:choline transport protein
MSHSDYDKVKQCTNIVQVKTIGTPIPLNSIMFSLSILVIIALINIGVRLSSNLHILLTFGLTQTRLVLRSPEHHHRPPHLRNFLFLRSIHRLVCSPPASNPQTHPTTNSLPSILQKRARGEPLPPSRFSLGKFGIPINLFAVFYVTVACIASFFPVVNSTAVADMNWSVVMFGGVLVIACVDYVFRGKKHYIEPVKHLNKM